MPRTTCIFITLIFTIWINRQWWSMFKRMCCKVSQAWNKLSQYPALTNFSWKHGAFVGDSLLLTKLCGLHLSSSQMNQNRPLQHGVSFICSKGDRCRHFAYIYKVDSRQERERWKGAFFSLWYLMFTSTAQDTALILSLCRPPAGFANEELGVNRTLRRSFRKLITMQSFINYVIIIDRFPTLLVVSTILFRFSTCLLKNHEHS